MPTAVVRPRDVDELLGVAETSREIGVPLTMRGAGTSIAGNAVGPGLVVDTARHLNRVLSVDPETSSAVVEPGAVHAVLQKAAPPRAPLRTRPLDPHPLHDRRHDRQQRLRLPGAGLRPHRRHRALADRGARHRRGRHLLRRRARGGPAATALAAVVDADLAHVRTHFGRFTRQVSGYSLEHLLPENGRRLDKFLVGSRAPSGW